MDRLLSRRPSLGRARRHAKTRGAILTEMPQRLSTLHCGEKDGAGVPTKMVPTHRRQPALVWDDLVSIVRQGKMRAEDGGGGGSGDKLGPVPPATHSEAPCKSPPKVTRMTYCFEANVSPPSQDPPSQARRPSALGRVARRLSPPVVTRMARRLSPPVVRMVMRLSPPVARMPLRFSPGRSTRTLDTYISDSNSDSEEDDTSSLDFSYSDDDSEVERAILASAAAFGGISLSDPIHDGDHHCAICLECVDVSSLAQVSGCEHRFCFGCISGWAEKKSETHDVHCPLCRESFYWALSGKKMRWY